MIMDKSTNAARFKPLAVLFLLSLLVSVGLGVFGPRLLGANADGSFSRPEWMLWTSLLFGVIAVATTPFAWRWLYRRGS
jgi:protein-S-isoprenylcysteine O-methyltransferase Ste14